MQNLARRLDRVALSIVPSEPGRTLFVWLDHGQSEADALAGRGIDRQPGDRIVFIRWLVEEPCSAA